MTESNSWARRALRIISVLPFILMLANCGGGSSQSATQAPTEEPSSTGSEPRIQLALTPPANTVLEFDTTGQQDVTVDGETRSRTFTTTVRRNAALSENGDGFQIESIPELLSFSPEDQLPVDLELHRVINKYDLRGVRSTFDPDDKLVDVLALETFRLPSLTLSHPATPVGTGAVWTERISVPGFNSSVATRVDAIGSNSISVSKTLDADTGETSGLTVTGTMNATYSIPALLMQSADINLTIRFEDQLYVNGVRQAVVDNTVFKQSIREVSP